MLTLLRTRRSVRRYQNRPIPESLMDILKEAVLRAPSSRNLTPWEFVFIRDKTLLKKLATCKPHGAAFLEDAPLGVVVCADPSISDVWVEDASIATCILHLEAHALGLGSCWIQIRKRLHVDGTPASEYIKKVLNLPKRLEIEAVIAIGFPEESKAGHPKNELLHARIIEK